MFMPVLKPTYLNNLINKLKMLWFHRNSRNEQRSSPAITHSYSSSSSIDIDERLSSTFILDQEIIVGYRLMMGPLLPLLLLTYISFPLALDALDVGTGAGAIRGGPATSGRGHPIVS